MLCSALPVKIRMSKFGGLAIPQSKDSSHSLSYNCATQQAGSPLFLTLWGPRWTRMAPGGRRSQFYSTGEQQSKAQEGASLGSGRRCSAHCLLSGRDAGPVVSPHSPYSAPLCPGVTSAGRSQPFRFLLLPTETKGEAASGQQQPKQRTFFFFPLKTYFKH